MNLNPDLIRSRAQEIEDSLRRLDKIGRRSEDAFLQDQDLRDIACYRLLVSIEAALSLCYHIAAKKLLKVPEGYADCFGLLAKEGLIDSVLGAPVYLCEHVLFGVNIGLLRKWLLLDQFFFNSSKYSSLVIPTVRILLLIISTSISEYSGITIARFASG